MSRLNALANQAALIRRNHDEPGPACVKVAELIMAAIAPAQQLAQLASTSTDAVAHAHAQLDEPFFFAKQEGEDTLANEAANATPNSDAKVLRALDKLALAAHDLAAKAGNDPRAGRPLGALGALGTVTAPLGWGAPSSPAAALAGRLTREPCAEGSTPNPKRCPMEKDERNAVIAEATKHLNATLDALHVVCGEQADDLAAMIEHDQKVAEMVAEITVDALLNVAAKGADAGMGMLRAKGALEATKAAATATGSMRKSLIEVAKDLGKSLKKLAAKQVAKAIATKDGDARRQTVAVVRGLPDVFAAAVNDIDFATLDDNEIDDLSNVADLGPARVREGVKALVATYRKNIEPLGETRVTPGVPSFRKTVTQAARLVPPGSGTPRLAMVKHTSDVTPGLRKDRAAPYVGAADVAHAAHLISDDAQAAVHDAAADDRYEFVRWIDAPGAEAGIDLRAIADADAIDLPMTDVAGLPLGALAGTADGAL